MAKVTSGEQAIEMVKATWKVVDPPWDNFKYKHQGYTWIVTYDEKFIDGVKKHEVRINGQKGTMVKRK